MSLDELNRRLEKAWVSRLEEDHADVIARALDLPREAIQRVSLAVRVLELVLEHGGPSGDLKEEVVLKWVRNRPRIRPDHSLYGSETIPAAVEAAIVALLLDGLGRHKVRQAVEAGAHVNVRPQALPGVDASRICDGCPGSIACLADNYAKPEDCLEGARPLKAPVSRGIPKVSGSWVRATPVSVSRDGRKVTVTCEHPRGTYIVDASEIK